MKNALSFYLATCSSVKTYSYFGDSLLPSSQ